MQKEVTGNQRKLLDYCFVDYKIAVIAAVDI